MKKLSNNQLFWVLLGGLSALAAGISLAIGLRQSVWFDEAYSILLAKHSFGEIVRLTSQDVHPPVYYWLLKVWMMAFGASEVALRSLSALCLGLLVGVAGLLLRRMFGKKIALLVVLFVAFAPFLLRYGFEIRMYAFVSFIGLLATYVLVLAINEIDKKRRRLLFVGYALLVALSVYTLYFMALVWMAHLTWLVWIVYKSKRKQLLVEGIAAYILSFLLFVPWLPVFLREASGSTLSPVTSQLNGENLLGIVTFTFLYHPPWGLGIFYWAAAAAVIVSVVALAMYAYKNITASERRYFLLVALYVIVPIFVLIVVTHFAPIYLERYIAHFIVGGYMLVGLLMALAWRSKRRLLLPCGIVVLALMAGCGNLVQYGNYNFQRVHKPSMKQISSLVSDCNDGAVVFANDPQTATELGYYVTDCPVYFYNQTKQMGGGFAPLSNSPFWVKDPVEVLRNKSKVFYVYYNKPERELPNTLRQVSVKTVQKLSVATYEHK